MKIIVRGISEETTKDEIKAIIREFCKLENVYAKADIEFCKLENVYAKADLSNKGNLKGVEVYPVGSMMLIGYISYDVVSGKPTSYAVINRRQVVKTYVLKEGRYFYEV